MGKDQGDSVVAADDGTPASDVDPVAAAFAEYRAAYDMRPPDLSRQVHDDEQRLIAEEEGLESFRIAPAEGLVTGPPPRSGDEGQERKFLWAVCAAHVPIALENGENRAVLGRGYLSHTNLTGGDAAYCGGELWFESETVVILNGGSSRYMPRDADELESVCMAMKACGYSVGHMGWDEGIGGFARYLRGEPLWV